MQEPEMYRPILERLLRENSGKKIWSQAAVARYTGKSRSWVRNQLKVPNKGITVEALAWRLAKEYA